MTTTGLFFCLADMYRPYGSLDVRPGAPAAPRTHYGAREVEDEPHQRHADRGDEGAALHFVRALRHLWPERKEQRKKEGCCDGKPD
jgi:hypothetical protein